MAKQKSRYKVNVTLADGTLKTVEHVDSITDFKKTIDKKYPTWKYLNYYDREKNEVKHIDRVTLL